MSEDFGADYISLTDEEGNEIQLEYVDTIEYNGNIYMAFYPAGDDGEKDEEDEDYGLVILKSIQEDGEELLSTLDSEEELEAVYNEFMTALFDDSEDAPEE